MPRASEAKYAPATSDQAAFRQDFPRWLRRLGSRKRRIAERMLLRERTTDLSRRFGVSQGQLRREMEADWRQFHGEGEAVEQEAASRGVKKSARCTWSRGQVQPLLRQVSGPRESALAA
jgi:hypothetical protein